MAITDTDVVLGPAQEPDASDYAQSIAKLGLSALTLQYPHLAPLLVAWDQFSGIVFSRRVAGFFESVRGKVRERSKSPESLFHDDQFVSALLQSIQTAARTHQTEKLEALSSAVLNVALGNEPNVDRQQQFLVLVDRFSVTHLSILRLFKDPARYFQKIGRTAPIVSSPTIEPVSKLLACQLVAEAMPSLSEQLKSSSADRTAASFQFIEMVLGELVSAKLITLDRHNDTWTVPKFDRQPSPSVVKPLTTHLGDDFLSFITEPPIENEIG